MYSGRTGPSKDLLMQDVNVIPTNTYTYSAAIEALRSAMVIVNTHIRKTETQVPLASCAEGSARGASLNVKSDQLEDVVRVSGVCVVLYVYIYVYWNFFDYI